MLAIILLCFHNTYNIIITIINYYNVVSMTLESDIKINRDMKILSLINMRLHNMTYNNYIL